MYLVRHAKAVGQDFTARLTDEGYKQAQSLVSFFEDIPLERIYSSPYRRTIETIEPLAKHRGLSVLEDERLGERVLADKEFVEWKEMLKKSFDDFDLKYPGGESNREGLIRVESLMKDLLQSPENHILLVSHGNLTTLLLHYFDKSYAFEELFLLSNPDVYLIECDEHNSSIQRLWK